VSLAIVFAINEILHPETVLSTTIWPDCVSQVKWSINVVWHIIVGKSIRRCGSTPEHKQCLLPWFFVCSLNGVSIPDICHWCSVMSSGVTGYCFPLCPILFSFACTVHIVSSSGFVTILPCTGIGPDLHLIARNERFCLSYACLCLLGSAAIYFHVTKYRCHKGESSSLCILETKIESLVLYKVTVWISRRLSPILFNHLFFVLLMLRMSGANWFPVVYVDMTLSFVHVLCLSVY